MQAVVDGSSITNFVLTPLYCKTAKVEHSVRINDLLTGVNFFLLIIFCLMSVVCLVQLT